MNDTPMNLEAEQALLGALLTNNDAMHNIPFLNGEDFYNPQHEIIFNLIRDSVDRGVIASPVTLMNKLDPVALEEVGGTKYLSFLAASAITILNAKEYGEVIKEMSGRRNIIYIAKIALEKAYDTTNSTAKDILDDIEQSAHEIKMNTGEIGQVRHITDCIEESLSMTESAMQKVKDGGIYGVPTGLEDLDNLIGGLKPKKLYYVGARPGIGKTVLALNIAKTAAKSGHATVMFSLEMDGAELASRYMSDISYETNSIPYRNANNGHINQDQFNALSRIGQDEEETPLWIIDSPNLSISDIRDILREKKRKLEKQGKKLGAVIIDYLGLLKSGLKYSGNKVNEVSEMSRELKNMSKEFGCPFLVLVQLNRGLESRDNKRPMLADMRDSGSLEQDADGVLFLHREAYYLAREEPAKGTNEYDQWEIKMLECQNEMEIDMAKHRGGMTGRITATAHMPTSALRNRR